MTVIIISTLMIMGCFFILCAAIGLIRLPDLYCRMHASGMAPTWAMLCVNVAAAVFFHANTGSFNPIFLLIMLCLFITAPVATHMILKGAYYFGFTPSEEFVKDDLSGYVKGEKNIRR